MVAISALLAFSVATRQDAAADPRLDRCPRAENGHNSISTWKKSATPSVPMRKLREPHFAERHLARIKKCKTLREDYTCPNCALCMIDALSRLGRSHHETSARLCLCVFLSAHATTLSSPGTSKASRRKARDGSEVRR